MMKNKIKLLSFCSLALLVLWSCSKDEHRDYFLGGTPPVLTIRSNTGTSDIGLHYADSTKAAVTLSWTNPAYKFTTGISSQDVNYQIQIDTTNSNFTNPQMKILSVSKELGYTITESELNDYLLNQLALKDSLVHHLEFRLISSISTGSAVPLTSNVVKLDAIPYAIPPKVAPPSSGALYITGDATGGGWQVGGDPSSVPADQQFTRVSPTEYKITVLLIGGKQYLLVPVAGNWDHKYACNSTADQSADGGDFGLDLSANFPGPLTSGTYTIDVDFQRGKYTVVQQ